MRQVASYDLPHRKKTSLLIDVQAKLNTGKGMGYANWAANFNLKQMAKTSLYVQEHGFAAFSDFQKEVDQAIINHKNLSNKIKATEKHMTEILELKNISSITLRRGMFI